MALSKVRQAPATLGMCGQCKIRKKRPGRGACAKCAKWKRNIAKRRTGKNRCIHCGASDPENGITCYRCLLERRFRRHGITPHVYLVLLRKQRNTCAICLVPRPSHVDHDHTTNQIRGILCSPCNRMLGAVHDDPTILLRAVTYLESR